MIKQSGASQKKEFSSHDLRWVERISTLLDSKFSIGGFRFGWDPLLNFFPIIGQIITFGLSLLLVIVMFRNGISAKAATKMLLNVVADAIVGAIPIAGNVLDFFSRANQRNIKILKEYYYEGKHQGSATGILSFIFIALLIFCISIFYLLWILGKWVLAAMSI